MRSIKARAPISHNYIAVEKHYPNSPLPFKEAAGIIEIDDRMLFFRFLS